MTRRKTYSIIALICSLWFLAFGWMWVYFFNMVFVFPVAITGFILWRKSKPESKNLLHTITGVVFLLGALISLAAIFLYS